MKICDCKRCELYKNQMPLIDKSICADVMWVGLSAKKVSDIENDIPLSPSTNSGKILHTVEERRKDIRFYKSNLVKCLPLDNKGKIRYPNEKEVRACIQHLFDEIDFIRPKVVFLLGNLVSSYVLRHKKDMEMFDKSEGIFYYNETFYVAINHPSYIAVYKRKNIDDYIQSTIRIINNLVYNTNLNQKHAQ